MDSSEYPSNSKATKGGRTEDKNITPVVTGAVRRKRSLRKQFSETFIGGDFKSTMQYIMLDVLLVSARDMLIDSVQQGIEKLILGESRRSRAGSTQPMSGPSGVVSYNKYAMGSHRMTGSQRAISRQARATHNFDEIVIPDRVEAEEVIDKLFELVSAYDVASVSDLYTLVGITPTHADHKWGWTDLYGAGATRIRGGYLLDLPQPEPIE